ncbi:MAG TPA: beta-L-arabinofuranosidase domain-containing protein [Bacteroidales bacterium]|nr:beta-L-arabinofuranosidase domain-containing protein [Bacteroidales bacterium]
MKYVFFLIAVLMIFNAKGIEPIATTGEIDQRIKMVSDRIMFGNTPEMSSDFILADISLKPEIKRRFTDFSGDISGRYFDVFSSYPDEKNPVNLRELMNEALQYQRPDGRFGNPELLFDPEKLAGPQMALLWGNGRLLVGLMKYYQMDRQSKVLDAAEKLGDFISGIAHNCTSPEVVERLKDNNYMGYICFTQLMEGLVLLWDETKNDKYLQTATGVFSLLPSPGKQHSHGYLNTLLGTLMLYERTGKTEQLKFVTDRYNELVNSPEYLIYGGVPEYFGSFGHAKEVRDEGCSEADFVMLSLDLWKTTGDVEYLEKAERCLINHLFSNQYQTGDFGHRIIDPAIGYGLDKEIARSWWCCNFHTLRALHETKEIIFTRKDNTVQFNLFFAGAYNDKEIQLTSEKVNNQSNQFKIQVLKAGTNSRLAVRKPSWATKVELTFAGKKLKTVQKGDYHVLDQPLQTGDQIDVELGYKMKWVDKDKREITFPITGKMQAALFYGPYLMSVDSNFQPFYDAEPSLSNYIALDGELKFTPELAPAGSTLKNSYVLMQHFHTEMFGMHPVVLRPICETTWQSPCNIRIWFTISQN